MVSWHLTNDHFQMMQLIDSVLLKGDKVDFFHDEFRCPVYVRDVVKIILALTNRWLSGSNLVSMLILNSEISGKLLEDSSGLSLMWFCNWLSWSRS